jgi:signal transduction histidine kinase
MGLTDGNRLVDDKNTMMSNRMNAVLIILLSIVSVLLFILRTLNHKPFSLHTQVLLDALVLCLINVGLSIWKKHRLVSFNLIFIFPLIIVFTPIFLGHARNVDFVYNPLLIIGMSFIPHLILKPTFTNKVYIIAILFFATQILFLDDISQFFTHRPLLFFDSLEERHIHYKIVLFSVFIFIQITMYYLRNINYKYEKKLFDFNEELLSTIEELKATQYQLIQSEKMASLGVLTAGVAHELNNPLNFISGGIHGIEEYVTDNIKEHKENLSFFFDAINEGIERSSKIVASLNHYSLQDENKKENCDINILLDNCLIMLQSQLNNNSSFIKQYTNQYFVYGNDNKLHQAFLNVLLNAVQSIEAAGEISIQTRSINSLVEIIICDNGCGINPESMKQIFDPFFTTKEPGKGTGLGLSVTYKILNDHNGTIDYSSNTPKGTKVVIRLPLIEN